MLGNLIKGSASAVWVTAKGLVGLLILTILGTIIAACVAIHTESNPIAETSATTNVYVEFVKLMSGEVVYREDINGREYYTDNRSTSLKLVILKKVCQGGVDSSKVASELDNPERIAENLKANTEYVARMLTKKFKGLNEYAAYNLAHNAVTARYKEYLDNPFNEIGCVVGIIGRDVSKALKEAQK